MSESRSNQAGQTGMAILIIVILFGVLFLGAGGVLWIRVRAQREAQLDEMRLVIYQEQVARERAEAANRMAEEARNAEYVQREKADVVSTAVEGTPVESNEPAAANNGRGQSP